MIKSKYIYNSGRNRDKNKNRSTLHKQQILTNITEEVEDRITFHYFV